MCLISFDARIFAKEADSKRRERRKAPRLFDATESIYQGLSSATTADLYSPLFCQGSVFFFSRGASLGRGYNRRVGLLFISCSYAAVFHSKRDAEEEKGRGACLLCKLSPLQP